MTDHSNFDWGWMDNSTDQIIRTNSGEILGLGEYHKRGMINEIFINKQYEKFFEVEDGDIVVDIGASVGPFTYSILHKKPKHVFCLEPSESEFKSLVKNTLGYPVTPINKGISNKNSIVDSDMLFGGENQMESITFKKFIELFGIEKIDFLKTDCEGAEYYIFCDENLDYLLKNVKKISGEWHLSTTEEKEKFRYFRDQILTKFLHYEVYSVDGIDIKWDLFNEHFIEYYNQVIIHIKGN